MAVLCVAVLLWLTPYLWGTQSPATSASIKPDVVLSPEKPDDAPVEVELAPSSVEEQANATPQPDTKTTKKEFTREPFLGTWQANPDGRLRTVTNREDGTATIHVKMDYLGSFFYGSELTMQCKWWIADGYLYHECQSGTPQANVTKLTNDLGAMTKFEILETTDKTLKLKDIFHYTDQVFEWKRVKDES